MKTDLSLSCGHCWVFQICWRIECSTLTASVFWSWSSSAGILSPPLGLFIVMFPNAHLTSHSQMSGLRRVITPSWLSGSWRCFLYSSVYSCHLLISSASASGVANKELVSRLDKELSVRKGCACVLRHFSLTVYDPMDCSPPGTICRVKEWGRPFEDITATVHTDTTCVSVWATAEITALVRKLTECCKAFPTTTEFHLYYPC